MRDRFQRWLRRRYVRPVPGTKGTQWTVQVRRFDPLWWAWVLWRR